MSASWKEAWVLSRRIIVDLGDQRVQRSSNSSQKKEHITGFEVR
jgi:hypothetical protein